MDLKLSGKTVLVTGSSRGIGKEIAKKFHDEGCIVILNGRDEKSLLKTFSEFSDRVSYVIGDVCDPKNCADIIKKIISKWGQLDILVCNVGSGNSVAQGSETYKEWLSVFHQNFLSTTNMVEAAKEELSKSKGNIVCISSISGLEYSDAPLPYSCAKSALNTFIKGISRPLSKHGIRINGVAPGNIMFDGSVWEKKLQKNSKLVNDFLKNEVALEKLGTPEEIANFVIFLSSSNASFATGSIIVVDGGQIK